MFAQKGTSMTAPNQELLDAIRVVVADEVGKGITPLIKQVDVLAERVDVLSERVDVVAERVDVLTERVDVLTERVDALTERVDRIELRLINLEQRVERLEGQYQSLSLTVAQIANDLYQLNERVEHGFAKVREDLNAFQNTIVSLSRSRQSDQKRIRALEQRVSDIQERLERLEQQNSSS